MKTPSVVGSAANFSHHRECLCLTAITLALFLPVMMHPHWGQFDDATLILQCGRRALDDPNYLPNLLSSGSTRIGIWVWTTALWKLFAGNPVGFYITNFIIFASTTCLLYWIAAKLTQNRFVSAISSGCIFTFAGLFEVIYTLDKQELFLPLLFAIVVLVHIYSLTCKKVVFIVDALLCLICAIAAYYTKECSAILCVFSASFFVAIFLSTQHPLEEKSRIRMLRAAIVSLATIGPYLYIHGSVPPANNGYIQLTFVPMVLLRKLGLLFGIDPVLALILLFVTGSWVQLTFTRTTDKSQLWWQAFSALTASTWVAIGALLCYDTGRNLLLYIWLPVYVFLLPALACALAQLTHSITQLRIRKFVLGALILLAISQVPTRVIQGQFQFQMDALIDALTERLASAAKETNSPILGATPFFEPGNYEVSENIECFVRSKLQSNYYTTKTEKADSYKFAMLNFLSIDCLPTHLDSDPPDVFRMKESRGSRMPYKDECAHNYVGWSGFQFLSDGTPNQNWVRRPFKNGTWLLVPYGDVQHEWIRYRGSGIFSHLWQSQLFVFPQMNLIDRGYIERKILVIGGHRKTMGWRILEVTEVQPLAAKLEPDGLLRDGEPIYYQYDKNQPVLKIKMRQPISTPISCTFSNGFRLPVSVRSGDSAVFDIPLQSGNNANQPLWIKLKSDDTTQEIYIDKMELSSSHQPTDKPSESKKLDLLRTWLRH